jgi:hypothetical protein
MRAPGGHRRTLSVAIYTSHQTFWLPPLVGDPLFLFRTISFYFFLRTFNSIRNIPWSSLRSDFGIWSIIDILAIVLVIAVQSMYQANGNVWSFRESADDNTKIRADACIRAFAAITTGLLWLKAVGFLKMVNMHLATFLFALVEVRKSIAAFQVPSNHKISYSRSFFFHRRPIDPQRYLLVSRHSRHHHGCFCRNLPNTFIRSRKMQWRHQRGNLCILRP